MNTNYTYIDIPSKNVLSLELLLSLFDLRRIFSLTADRPLIYSFHQTNFHPELFLVDR